MRRALILAEVLPCRPVSLQMLKFKRNVSLVYPGPEGMYLKSSLRQRAELKAMGHFVSTPVLLCSWPERDVINSPYSSQPVAYTLSVSFGGARL